MIWVTIRCPKRGTGHSRISFCRAAAPVVWGDRPSARVFAVFLGLFFHLGACSRASAARSWPLIALFVALIGLVEALFSLFHSGYLVLGLPRGDALAT